MKKQDIGLLVRLMLTPVLLAVLGVVLVLRPDSASALIAKVLGWLLVLLGGGTLLSAFLSREGAAGKAVFCMWRVC